MVEMAQSAAAPIERKRVGWLRWLFLILSVVWLVEEFLRAAAFVARAWGVQALILDGLVLYKLGELLIALPLLIFVFLRPRWNASQLADYVSRSKWLFWAGALLNVLAYFGLRSRIDWWWWPLALVALGFLLPLALKGMAARGLGWAGWLLALVFFLLQAAAYFIAFLFNGYAFTPLPASYPRPADTRDARWEQDVHYLSSELVRLHKNAYHTVSPDQFEAQTSQLLADIPALDDQQVALRLMSIAALVGDAHTGIDLQNQMQITRYPLHLYWFEDGLFVIAARSDYTPYLRARVLRIGSRSAEEALAAVRPLISYENDSWLKLQSTQYLLTPEILHAVGVIDEPGSAPFVFEMPDGEKVEAVIQPLKPGEQWDSVRALTETPLYLKNSQENFWYEYLEDSGTLYFKYNACNDLQGFQSFTKQLWLFVDEHPVQRLIIDFRGNGGGNSMQFDRFFLPGLLARPNLNHPDRLFAIINRGTFSSATDNVATLDLKTQVTLVGEPTGGSPNGYGEVRSFNLPNSGIRVHFSTKYFQLTESDDPWIMPDVPVEFTSQVYFSGRDAFLEAALQK